MDLLSLILAFLEDAAFAAVPAAGFAVLFNVPRQHLKYCALAGALAHSIRFLLLHMGMELSLATFVVSIGVGILGLYWSQKFVVPTQVYTVAAIIPMIPGKYAFTTVVGLVNMHNATPITIDQMQLVLDNGLQTISILLALSIGLAVPRLVFSRAKPVV